jgi:hypothetical protein
MLKEYIKDAAVEDINASLLQTGVLLLILLLLIISI